MSTSNPRQHDVTALAEKEGLRAVEVREIGWNHHLWILERPA